MEEASLGLLEICHSRSRHSWYDQSETCISLYSYNTLSVMPCNHGAGKKLHKFQCRACAACLQTLPVCLKAWSRYVAWTQAPIRDSARHHSEDWLDSHHRSGLTASQSGPNIGDAPVTRNFTKKKKKCFIIFMRKRSCPLPCISQKWKGWHFDSYLWTSIVLFKMLLMPLGVIDIELAHLLDFCGNLADSY